VLLVSWNLAGRVKRLDEQAERLAELDADVVCLQELTRGTLPVWRERLLQAGYVAAEHPDVSAATGRTRPLFVLTALRQGARHVAVGGVPWPERVLSLQLEDGTEIVNVHSPISPKPGLVKIRTHLAVYEHLARAEARPRILCGDLNTPRREFPDGLVWTFARDQYGRLRPDRGEEWDEAELLLIRGLDRHGFRDAFRGLHGHERREISWGWQRWKGGYRLDHLLVSGLSAEECHYEHRWREEGLSDHAPLIARLAHSG
jgi:exodeoxyribonuclease-3